MIDNLISRLNKVKSVGGNRYVALCPAHEDRKPSLSIAELNDGRILIHCFAGCDPLEVLNSVGLEMVDLFPDGALGEFRGWFQMQRDMENKKSKVVEDKLELEKIVLAMAKRMRHDGKRLSPQDLARELEAYKKVKHYEHNNG